MTPQEFIQMRLADLNSGPKMLPEGDIAEQIYKLLMSKKFRKYASTPAQQKGIQDSIALNIKNRQPIRFGFPFGAYKLWRFEETPESDWAELFTLMYYAKWLRGVAEIYEPGVVFDFISDEVVIERMNNISKAETAAYAASLQTLFDFMHAYTAPNFKFTLTSIGSFYEAEEFERDLAARVQELMAKNGGNYPRIPVDAIPSIEMNVRLKQGQADDTYWREKVDVVHHAYYQVKKRRPYNAAPETIAVFPTMLGNYNCIAVGTTKTSIAKFWVGVGALKRKDDGYSEMVLSLSQLERAKFDWIPASIEGLSGKNFTKIRVTGEAQ